MAKALQTALDRFAARRAPSVAVGLVSKAGTFLTASAGGVDADTAYLTASISKTVVAALCMQCVERNEICIDQDINTFLTDLTLRNPHFPSDPITSRHLLTHCSGLIDDETALAPGVWRTDGQDYPAPLTQYIARRMCPAGPDYDESIWSDQSPPGKCPWHYSNAGFATLGLVLEECTGMLLEQLAQERLFQPLGMHNSTFRLDTALQYPKLAQPHQFSSESGTNMLIPHYGVAEYPACMLRSTVNDLCRYLVALLNSDERILSSKSVTAMMPTETVGNGEVACSGGLGWWGADAAYGDQSGESWTHGGFMHGVRTHIYVWPKLQSAAVILTNSEADYYVIECAVKGARDETIMSQPTANPKCCAMQ